LTALVLLVLPSGVLPVVAKDPPGHVAGPGFLREGNVRTSTATPTVLARGQVASAAVAGFSETAVITGLTFPTSVRFAPNGQVFVAEKSGLIKVFSSLSDTTAAVVADLRTQVDDYWDRGLLGLAVSPGYPGDPYIYAAYTFDAPIGGTAPVWNDACPSPPGPTTDGCVVSSRVVRIRVSGETMTAMDVLVNDWCQQFPSHSIGDLRFGADGALYVTGGDGASFTAADTGQLGGSAGSPTPVNPCGDPANEGGALRAQDLRTMPSTGGTTSYRTTVLADGPVAYWRLGDTGDGIIATDDAGVLSGWYGGTLTRGVAGAIAGDANSAVALDGTSGYVGVPDYSQLDLANGPLSIEFWVKRRTTGGPQAVIDRGPGSFQVFFGSDNRLTVARNGGAVLARDAAALTDIDAFHHFVITKSGTSTRIYRDGADVTAPGTDATLTNTTTNLWLGRWNDGTAYAGIVLDEVALYGSALSAARVTAHYQAAATGGWGGTTAPDPVSLDGSVIRIDPATGDALPTNPNAASPDANARRIVAQGTRSAFRFTVRPGTSELWLGDVGWGSFEEINRIVDPTAGVRNLGWPCYEGTGQQGSYAGTVICGGLYADATAPATGPYFSYGHASTVVSGESCPTGSSAIAGLAFYTGTSYPAEYRNALFFADNSRDCLWAMLPGADGLPDPATIRTILSPAANPVGVEAGPGGDIFYVDFDGGTVRHLTYQAAGNQPPTAVITATPTSGPAPLAVSFSAAGSTDREGGALAYAWDLDGDGAFDDATGATASWTYASPGSVTAGLRVTDPLGASSDAAQAITVGAPPNTPPVVVIDAPVASLTWAVGDTIAFSGHALDAEDGPLPNSALAWQLVMHHCPSNCHTHQVQAWAGVASGSFQAPDHEAPSHLELVLTATDSGGATSNSSVRLDPRTVTLSVRTSTPGLGIDVTGVLRPTPFDMAVIEGGTVSVSAPSPQVLTGTTYTFASWSDGREATHDVTLAASLTLTATYTSPPPPVTSYRDTVVGDGPIAYWRLGETAGVVASDTIGTRSGWYGGTSQRGIAGAIAGDPDGAVSLDGASGYVGVPSSNAPRLGDGPLSVELWVRRNAATGTQPVIDAGPRAYQLYFSSTGKLTVTRSGTGTIVAETTPTTDTTTWHHYVFTKNGAAVKLYRDGVDVTGTVTNRTLSNAAKSFWIGRWDDGTRYGNVRVDEVAVYAKVLTAAQVTAHYRAGTGQ
jgi:glucose/arabinose dehydrogenase